MDAPQNNEWGPEMWKILHGLAEKIGSYQTIVHRHRTDTQLNEEKRLWNVLLVSLRLSLPCPLCRKHYSDYINKHPLDNIIQANGPLLKDSIRIWLYNLHNDVNQRGGKSNFSTENLSELYRNINYNHSLNIVANHMRRGLNKQWVSRDDVGRTIRILKEIFIFYACF